MKPKRIQRRRTKGWKMPEGAIYVGRPTQWGNPFKTVEQYRQCFEPIAPYYRERIRAALRGKDLACWCPLDQPCHADILLEIANS